MKKVLFCLIIGVLISNVYAEKSKIVKHFKFNEPLKKYLGSYILKTEKGYKLSTKGFLVSNVILAEFLI